MAYELLLGSASGTIIDYLRVNVERVSWILNEPGSAVFSIARTDAKFTADNIKTGNRVLINFDNGLPSWGGVIAEQSWSPAGVEVGCDSADVMLNWRKTARSHPFESTLPGSILTSLYDAANSIYTMPFLLGEIWSGGTEHSVEYNSGLIGDLIRDSLIGELGAAKYTMTAAQTAGRIVFTLNLYGTSGSTKSSVWLSQSRNVVGLDYRINGRDIVNAWDTAGSGDGWGDSDRVYGYATDTTSVNDFGYREGFAQIDAELQVTVDNAASDFLGVTKDEQILIAMTVKDLTPGLFTDYAVGDTIKAYLPDYGFNGFEGNVCVKGREYFPGSDVCDLVVEAA